MTHDSAEYRLGSFRDVKSIIKSQNLVGAVAFAFILGSAVILCEIMEWLFPSLGQIHWLVPILATTWGYLAYDEFATSYENHKRILILTVTDTIVFLGLAIEGAYIFPDSLTFIAASALSVVPGYIAAVVVRLIRDFDPDYF